MSPRPTSLKKNIEIKKEVPILALDQCLAKTKKLGDVITKGCTVEAHSAAALLVAKALLRYFQLYRSGSLFLTQDLLAILLHDVGKVSMAFQCKLYNACGEASNLRPWSEENHCVTSSLTLEEMGLKQIAQVAIAHHGRNYSNTGLISATHEGLGGQKWEDLRESLVKRLSERFDLPLMDLPEDEAHRQLVLGLTVLADWLSSGLELDYGKEATEAMAEQAIQDAGFVPFTLRENLKFGDVFQTKDGKPFQAKPIQTVMGNLADSSFLFADEASAPAENPADKPETGPSKKAAGSTVVLEMEMGGGKTEAALYLAYRLMVKHGHNGVYFALPTRLTSDKIYERFEPFLDAILKPECQKRKTQLLHSKAWLRKNLYHTGEEGFLKSGETYVDDWFNSRKRGLLAPFAVGTIDQLLMAVINVKHNALRALGVAGKVVILDEVHSYDAYTGMLIQRLVEFLQQWGCSVIILSATLTKNARDRLLGKSSESSVPQDAAADAYPLLSISNGQQIEYPPIPSEETQASKHVRFCWSNSRDASNHALKRAQNGECVLWIENTVGEAQQVYWWLHKQAPQIPIGLIHSRFPESVRQENEGYWVKLYGKDADANLPDGNEQASGTEALRPAKPSRGGKILIGTQVLEQSVDIDADYLITRLCPMDMLLQRIGRLWRHRSLDERRAETAECAMEILNETPFENSETFRDGEEKRTLPYAAYVMMRTQEVLNERLKQSGTLSIPEDIRPLLEATYAEQDETGNYAMLKQKMEQQSDKLKRFAQLSSGTAVQTQSDTEAATRWTEEETVEVLLFDEYDPANHRVKLHGQANFITIPDRNAPRGECVECARLLNAGLIQVRESIAPRYEDFELDALKHVLYIGHETERPLRAAFVKCGGRLLNRSASPITDQQGRELSYYNKLGYFVQPKEKK